MTGSEYAMLNRWSLDDLRSLANLQLARAQRLLGRPLVAQLYLDLAEQFSDSRERRRYYLAAYREAREALEQLPSANGLFELVLPKDIKNEIDALKSSYDVVNQTAKGRSDWDVHYQEFLQFYEKNKDPGWLTSSYATLTNIRERAQRLEEWKKKLSTDGVKILEPEKKAPPSPTKDAIDSASVALLLGIGGFLLMKSSGK